MTERKYKFKYPRNTNERIEAMYEELRETTPLDINHKPEESLKDLVAALLKQSKTAESAQKDDNKSNIALSALAFLAFALLANGLPESRELECEWLTCHRFAVWLWGIAFASVYVGVSIEKSQLIQILWKFGFTKVITSIAVSALLIFCTGKASSLINNVFGVDASVFSFTRAYITGFLAFQYISPLLFVVAFLAFLHALIVILYVKSKFSAKNRFSELPWNSLVFLVLALFVLGFSWNWINRDFSDSALPTKIYILAHALDFNSHHSCVNIEDGVNVVFVGSDYSKVLVDTNHLQVEGIEAFFNSTNKDIMIPKSFSFMTCQTGVRAE